jgi:hypothetical protein
MSFIAGSKRSFGQTGLGAGNQQLGAGNQQPRPEGKEWYATAKAERAAFAAEMIHHRIPEMLDTWKITPEKGEFRLGTNLPKAESIYADLAGSKEEEWVHLLEVDTLHATLFARKWKDDYKIALLNSGDHKEPRGLDFQRIYPARRVVVSTDVAVLYTGQKILPHRPQ